MAICNRDLDLSQQNYLAFQNLAPTVTAKSDAVIVMPQAGTIQSLKLGAVGLSGSPTAQVAIRRFVVGAGQTLIPLGPALALQAVGTSGLQSYSFSLATSALTLQAQDAVVVTHGGANAACEQLNVALVIQATQDIKSWTW